MSGAASSSRGTRPPAVVRADTATFPRHVAQSVTAVCSLTIVGLGLAASHTALATPRPLPPVHQSTEEEGSTAESTIEALEADFRASPTGSRCLAVAGRYREEGKLEEAREHLLVCISSGLLSQKEAQRASFALVDIEELLLAADALPAPQRLSPQVQTQRPSAKQEGPSRTIEGTPLTPAGFPLAHTERPMSLTGGTLSLSGGVGFGHSGQHGESSFGLGAAAAYGIVDRLEVGVFAMQLQLYERVVYDRPALYLLAQLSQEADYALGARLEVVAGVQANTPWTVSTAISQYYLPFKGLRVDSSLILEFIPREEMVNMHTLVELSFQISEAFYAALDSGLVFILNSDDALMPLGVSVGYTIADGERPLCDLSARVGWPIFYQLTRDSVDAETISAEVNVRCFLSL